MLRKPIHVQFGKPYYPNVTSSHIPPDKMAVLTEEVMLKIADMMPERYWGYYRDRMHARALEAKSEVANV